jgi:hypothetical protein
LHHKAPVESYVTFDNKGAGSLIVMVFTVNRQGKTKSFGPYTQDEVKFLEK